MIKAYKILRLILMLGVFGVCMAVLHELGHHLMATILGVATTSSPSIAMFGFWAGYYEGGGATDHQFQLVAFSGGLFVALVYGLIWVVVRFNPTWWDTCIEFATGTLAALQLGAGLAEGVYLPEVRAGIISRAQYEQTVAIVMLIFMAPMVIYCAWRWAHFLMDDNAQ